MRSRRGGGVRVCLWFWFRVCVFVRGCGCVSSPSVLVLFHTSPTCVLVIRCDQEESQDAAVRPPGQQRHQREIPAVRPDVFLGETHKTQKHTSTKDVAVASQLRPMKGSDLLMKEFLKCSNCNFAASFKFKFEFEQIVNCLIISMT